MNIKAKEKDQIKKNAIIVGGGTGGHIIPAIVVASLLIKKGYIIKWIGSIKNKELERKLILNYFPQMKIYHIFSGKLRRKKNLFLTILNINNILDLFQVMAGVISSIFILLKEKPDFIFSKGGFVSVPMAIASKIVKKPFFTHESDYTIGLANKINLYFSKKFFYSFKDTGKFLPEKKAVFSSNPIREEFFQGYTDFNIENLDKKIKNFIENLNKKYPLILILGGSLGSSKINNLIFKILPELLKNYNIIHQTGDKKEIDFSHPNYCQVGFISNGVSYCMKNSDLIISRSGANLVFEIVATKKPAIFIPLVSASRGEQINNAKYFLTKSSIYSMLDENTLDETILLKEIEKFFIPDKFSEKYKETGYTELHIENIRAENIIVETIESTVY